MAEPDHQRLNATPESDQHSIELVVDAAETDLVVDRIWLCDPLAVGEADTDDGRVRFTVGFDDRDAALGAMAQLEDWQPTLKAVRAAEWVDTWRRRATPQDAGPFRVRLPEHAPGPDRLDLVIEPGTSFGFGHPSTLLALELLADIPVAGATVADVGSGSGVLAIASRVLGALDVHAVDIASDAVAATRDNATRNGVEITVTAGSVDTLPRVVFDLVLANLTAATQAEVLPLLADRIGPSTTVVLSGLLDGQESRVSALVGSHEIAAVARRDGWIAVRLTAPRIASPTS